MSPGFTSRPSLSVDEPVDYRVDRQCVAGIHVPAFVERWPRVSGRSLRRTCVAGIHVPAFVERRRSMRINGVADVSPGFTSRPSLSVDGPLGMLCPA